MIYNFGMKSDKALYNSIDSKEVLTELKEIFEIDDFNTLGLKIKDTVKKPKEFDKLCEKLNIDRKEGFVLISNIFTEIFTNKRTVSSIARIYKKEEKKKK